MGIENSSSGKMSPLNVWTTTIGDELKLATNFKSKVYGVSLKDRGAIIPAGHSADGAFGMIANQVILLVPLIMVNPYHCG